jgi:NDP-sugar pyrophosphorylase family protein
MKAMILAAGLGTRLKPFTDFHPKALAPVHGKPILAWNIEYLYQYGVRDIIINVHHFADQIIAFIETIRLPNLQISISDERDAVLETGGGLKKTAWFFNNNEPFILMNADILTDMPLDTFISYHNLHGAVVTLAVSSRESSRCFLWNKSMQLCGWRNKTKGEEILVRNETDLTEFSFSGMHIINPIFFKYVTQEGKFSIVDTYLATAKLENIIGFNHSGYKLLDIGKPESLALAETMF